METKYINKREKWAYGWAAFGQGAVYTTLSSWQLVFYTDVVQANYPLWTVGTVQITFLSLIMWIARIWDAVNDPIMGVIMDRHSNFKGGKMRPWLIYSVLPIAVTTLLVFINPNFSRNGTMIYIFVTYFLWDMAYTLSDVPFWSLPSVMTPNADERAGFVSFSRVLNSVGSALPLLLVTLLINDKIAGQNGYFWGAAVAVVIMVITYLNGYKKVHERIKPTPQPKQSVKEFFKMFGQNKPLVLAFIMGILSFGRYMVQASMVYAARYVFEYQIDKGFAVILTAALVAVGMFPAMLIMPKLYQKFNFRQIAIGAGLLSLVNALVFYGVGVATHYNLWAALPFLFISGFPLGVFNVITFNIISDSVDYMEWKTGKRAEGMMFSTQTFMNKFGQAITAGLVPMLLGTFGYIAPYKIAEITVYPVQNDAMRDVMFMMITLIPAISMAVSTIPMLFYDYVGVKKQGILDDLAIRRAA